MRQPRATHVGVTFNDTVMLKAQLQLEITKLERQLDAMRGSEQAANFGVMQTYKEMIHARKETLNGLPN